MNLISGFGRHLDPRIETSQVSGQQDESAPPRLAAVAVTDMPTIQKIAAFWLCVHLGLWLLRRRPNSAISRFAFSWQGPSPVVGELKSSYYRRKAIFALGWLVQIVTAAALVALAMYAMPRSESTETPILVAAFTLTLGSGMAVLGALLAALVSLKASLVGPNPAFSLPAQGQQADAAKSDHESEIQDH